MREKVTSYESAKMHSTRTPQGGKIAQRALPSMENGAAHDGESMRHPATFTECVLGHDRPDERWNREGVHEIGSESVAPRGPHLARKKNATVPRPKPGRKPRRARNHRGSGADAPPRRGGGGEGEAKTDRKPGEKPRKQRRVLKNFFVYKKENNPHLPP